MNSLKPRLVTLGIITTPTHENTEGQQCYVLIKPKYHNRKQIKKIDSSYYDWDNGKGNKISDNKNIIAIPTNNSYQNTLVDIIDKEQNEPYTPPIFITGLQNFSKKISFINGTNDIA